VPPPEKGATLAFIRQRLFSFVMVIGVGLLLVVLAASSIIFSWISSFFQLDASGQIFSLIAFLGVATLSFALIFKVLPDIKIAWRDVWIGAAVTALLVTVGGLLITFYLKSSSIGSALEVAGSFAVVLLGIYYVATIFLLGAIFTRVYAHMFGSWRESTVEGE
jgi:membrane protein